MTSNDYLIDNFSLQKFIPEYLRTKTINTLISNLFDRHLTKDESISFYGYVGKKQTDPTDNTPFVTHNTQERRINNLIPLITGTNGTETDVFSFDDILNRCRNLGIDTDKFYKWGASTSFNFAPPIDLDKFVNYKRYVWVATQQVRQPIIPGNLDNLPEYIVIKKFNNSDIRKESVNYITHDESFISSFSFISFPCVGGNFTPSIGDRILFKSNTPISKFDGIYNITASGPVRSDDFKLVKNIKNGVIVNDLFTKSSVIFASLPTGVNDDLKLSSFNDLSLDQYTDDLVSTFYNTQQSIDGNIPIDNDWSRFNFWVHEDDLADLGINKHSVSAAIRPIIEFDNDLELSVQGLNLNIRDSQKKQFFCQSPVFNQYHFSGSLSPNSGTIFNYDEDPSNRVDQFIQRRIAREKNTDDFLFVQSLIEPDSKSSLFFKRINTEISGTNCVNTFSLNSLWSSGPLLNQPIIATQRGFKTSDARVTIDSIGEKESTDSILFTAINENAVTFESKVLGKYSGPIIRSNVNLSNRDVRVIKDSTIETINITQLATYIADGWIELMSPIYVGETIEIPQYLTFTFHAASVGILEKDDTFVNRAYTAEIPRYVRYDSNQNLVDLYLGEKHDLEYARTNNVKPAGAWLTPKQLKQNILHENREQFAFGDLTGHFRLIMSEQPGIEGSLNGSNNYRTLESYNFGLGGLIKNYNFEYNLLISHLLQSDLTPLTILDFIESQYAQNILSIKEFVRKSLAQLLTIYNSDSFTSIDSNSDFINNIFSVYSTYLQQRSDLNVFSDSSMPIPRWILTLPAARIIPVQEPQVLFDNDFGVNVIKHHDGHHSEMSNSDYDFNQAIALFQVNPDDESDVGGFVVDSLTPPTSKPWFKGMAWFNPTSKVLRTLNVIANSESLTNNVPLNPSIDDFWLVANELYQYTNTGWVQYTGDPMVAWVEIKPESIIDSLVLNVENRIYKSLVSNDTIFEQPSIRMAEEYETELVKYAAKYGFDVYAPDYVPTDAFTWNYKLANFSAIDPSLNGLARWNTLYEQYLGTKRPYFEPWKIVNITDPVQIADFIALNKTRFQDSSNLTLYPLQTNKKISSVRVISDENVDISIDLSGGHCPNIIDGVELIPGDKVLLVNQNDASENGIYSVSSVGSGLNGVWVNTYLVNHTHDTNSWIDVQDGLYWKGTAWVVSNINISGSIVNSVEFEQYRYWKQSMWVDVKIASNKKLCMNVFTEQLIPPYVSPTKPESSEALITSIPSGVNLVYTYGDMGPTELIWTKSIEYMSSVAKVEFKKSPMEFLLKTWGDVYASHPRYDEENRFGRTSVKKLTHQDIILHGEANNNYERKISYLNPDLVTGLTILSGFESVKIKLTVTDFHIEHGYRTFPIFNVYVNDSLLPIYVKTSGNNSYMLDASIVDFNGNTSNLLETEFGIIPSSFKIAEHGHGFNFGDGIEFTILNSGIDNNSINIISSTYYSALGLNQIYTHLMRYNNYDTTISFNNTFLRKWDVKFGYRFDSIVKSDDVKIKSETYDIPNNLRTIHLKTNPSVSEFWIHALRIQVVKIGKYTTADKTRVQQNADGSIAQLTGVVAAGDASDWMFRIENYNARNPFIDVFTYNTSGLYETFVPLNDTNNRTWKKYTEVTGSERISLPQTITGLQNLINVVYGYIDKIESDGWRFNLGNVPNIDEEINRTITWQSDLEKFISYVYTGINEGEGNILNPFKTNLWFDSPKGMLSKFEDSKFVDFDSSQVICDFIGNVITTDNLRILRDENLTQISSLIPMFSAHVFIDEYEHVVLFDDYIDKTNKFTLVFDPYLGISVSRLLFDGERHPIDTGRPVLGGHYLNGQTMQKNMMKQTDEFADYYDSTKILKNPKIAKNSLALVGYNKKDYFEKLGISDTSQFNFWQALIKSKGTNQNIDAYLNNNIFKTAYLDEYWAYKIAEYGDARTEEYPELKINVSDSDNSYSIFSFNGLDSLVDDANIGRTININQLSDSRWLYTNKFDQKMINYFMNMLDNGQWTIDHEKLSTLTEDEKYELEKILNKHFYFSAKRVAKIDNFEQDILTGKVGLNLNYRDEDEDLTDINNKIYIIDIPKEAHHSDMVVAKFFRKITLPDNSIIFDEVKSHIIKSDTTSLFAWNDIAWNNMINADNDVTHKCGKQYTINNLVYRNKYFDSISQNYLDIFSIPVSNLSSDNRTNIDPIYDTMISRVNGNSLRFVPSNEIPNDEFKFYVTIDGGSVLIEKIELHFYAIDVEKHNGTKLFDYSKNTLVDEIPIWHPQVQSVSNIGLQNIDYISDSNPAKYEFVPNDFINSQLAKHKPWGNEQVGMTWWNKSVCEYVPYYDNKIYPNLQDRISRWGKLTDYSSMDVYEWVSSPVPPSEYDALALEEESNFSIDESVRLSGRAALPQNFRSQRIWSSRPVAWSHVNKPIKTQDDILTGFNSSADSRLFITTDTFGKTWITIDTGDYSDLGIKTGTMLVGWGNSGYVESDLNKPFGQLQFGEDEMFIIGQEISQDDFLSPTNQFEPKFTKIKSRASEMNRIANTTSDPQAFLQDFLIKDVIITKIKDGKPINALGEIKFELDGFTWDSAFINYFVKNDPSFGITITSTYLSSAPNANSTGLKLNLIEVNNSIKDIKETINISDEYLCSESQDIVFDFPRTNIRVIFKINQNHFDSLGIGKSFNSIPFYHIFGGKATIANFEQLDPNISSNLTLVKSFTDRDGEFFKFDMYSSGGVLTSQKDSGSIYIRKMISGTVISPFDTNLLSNYLTTTNIGTTLAPENVVRPEQFRGWKIFELPTQEDLDNDPSYPYNLWIPVIGDSIMLTQSEDIVIDDFGTISKLYSTEQSIIDFAVEMVLNGLKDKNGTSLAPFTSTWGEWIESKTYYYSKTVINAFDPYITIELKDLVLPVMSELTVYLNGQIQPQKLYSLVNNTLIFNNGNNIPQGNKLVVKYAKPEPTAAELEFNPDVEDDVTKQIKFKRDYPYCLEANRDSSGNIIGYTYFFWVSRKNTKSINKKQSVYQIASSLENKPSMFMTLQNILPAKTYTTSVPVEDVLLDLPIRYQIATIHGLDVYVKRNDAFKIRFVKNFTLRNNPNDIDLKNTHQEWVLIRPGLSNRLIPKKLWDKVVDSVCGIDKNGYNVPSYERIDYDTRHETRTKYGFNSDQTLCDSDTLIETIKYILLNTKILKRNNLGIEAQDFIDFLDLDNLDQYFVSPEKSRETLDLIWVKASKRHVNEIFFACLEDIAALNYEMTDLFKTSRLSVYSLRTINEIPRTGIVYDN